VRSSKTTWACDFIIDRGLFYPGSKHIITRKSEKSVREKTWLETVLPVLKLLEATGICKIYRAPTKAIIEIPGYEESHILIGGLAPSEIDGILGIEYSTVLVDEVSEVSYNAITSLYTRLNERKKHIVTGKPIKPMILFTQNPPTTNHFTYKIWHKKVDPITEKPLTDTSLYGLIQINPLDNIENLAPTLLKELESLSDRAKLRFLYGKYGQTQGLVYDNFDPEKHIIDDEEILEGKRYDLKKAKLYRVIDFGFVHPFVCLWIAHFPDDTTVIYREFYAKGKTVRLNKIEINKLSKGEKYEYSLSDHDSEDRATLAETDNDPDGQGITTRAANKEVIAGIDKVYDLYNVNKIKVLRSLTNFIGEKYSYQWKVNSVKDREVIKLDDDGQDCERYFVNDLHKPRGVANKTTGW